MDYSIFNIELPTVASNEELNKIKSLYLEYDPYFITSGCSRERREKFNKLWNKYKIYADSHFLTQVKINFHQRTWEMYLGNVLLEKGLKIESNNEGPDFIVKDIGYIECVAPTKGDNTKTDSVPEPYIAKKPGDIRLNSVPFDKIILRITQVLKDKALIQYENWKNKKWFNNKTPFILAINTGDLDYPEDSNMPNIIKALFGFQFMQINVKTGAKNYSHRNLINKTNGEEVGVNYFIDPNFSFISGVIFSNKTVLNHPDKIGDDCIFVNNPLAINPVNKKIVSLFDNWEASIKDNKISLTKNY